MRVVEYETFEVPPRWQFLKLTTSDGAVGWGEPVLEGRARTVRTAVEELVEQFVLGADPMAIERRWQQMYRGGFYRGGPVLMSAIAGIDQALWDLKGKHYDAPVFELLGGRARDRVRLYQHVSNDHDDPADVAAEAAKQVRAGFTALKMPATHELRRIDAPATVERAEARMAAVREAVGEDVDVGLDVHGRASKAMAKRLAVALEPYEPMFIEEPVLPEHTDALPEIAAHTTIPIATGERLFSRWDVKALLESQAVDVLQPDLSHAGGITEVRKIAAMAETYGVALAPHCPLGPVALAACLQVDACAPNALVQEQILHYEAIEEGWPDLDGLGYLRNPDVFTHDGGYVSLPDGPGLGIEIDEDYVHEMEAVDAWTVPQWRHEDGSIAEW